MIGNGSSAKRNSRRMDNTMEGIMEVEAYGDKTRKRVQRV